MNILQYSRPRTAIIAGRSKRVGFLRFVLDDCSDATRGYESLAIRAAKNVGYARNIVAYYLLVCGLTSQEASTFLGITASRVLVVARKGRLDVYPDSERSRLLRTHPSYRKATPRAKRSSLGARLLINQPATLQELQAHRLCQGSEEKFDAEDVLSRCTRGENGDLIAEAVERGRARFLELQVLNGEQRCPCSACARVKQAQEMREERARRHAEED